MIHLGLIMTKHIGFTEWQRSGLLDREIQLYQSFSNVKTTFFHDDAQEVEYQGLHFLPKGKITETKLDLIKSNQIYGSDEGLQAAREMKIPFILRCGYSWAEFEKKKAIGRLQKMKATRFEKKIAGAADVCVVSNVSDQELFVSQYGLSRDKVKIHPNYVDCDLFKPSDETGKNIILNVGRLVTQKNQALLLRAAALLEDVEVVIVGEGPEEEALKQLAGSLNVNLSILPVMSPKELRSIYNKASVFALTSDYEGLPKVVLEAMASGCVVVSTAVQGVQEAIQNGETGFICEKNEDKFSSTLSQVIKGENSSIQAAARQLICDMYSLGYVSELEESLYKKLCGVDRV